MIFVSEIPTILMPGTTNICITVAAIWGIYTCVWGCSPACALLEIIWRGSTPIQHLNVVTWYPPACWCRAEKQTTFTLVFDKLLAICRDHRNARYLRDTAHSCPDVMNISHITSLFLETIYQSSIFTVVTKYSHTNSILVYHVTVDAKGIVSSFAVGINDERITFTFLFRITFLFRCRFYLNGKEKYIIGQLALR